MTIVRLAIALFLVQAGFHGYTAALPLALARAGVPDANIGLIVGTAALVQIPAALLGGRLVDRFGGVRLLVAGAAAYLLATGIILLPSVEPDGSAIPYFAARALQGIGIAAALPASLSLVPRIVTPARQGVGLSFVGSAHNLTLVLLPPISIAVLDASSLHGVGLLVVGLVVAGLLLVARLPVRPIDREAVANAARATRRFGITFRRAWAIPLLVIVCYVAHWGAVVAYLPARAEQAGANIGLYFAADGLAIFAMRLPTGWLTDRIESRALIVSGGIATAVAVGLLLLPLSTPLLIVSGLVGGAGGAVVMTPILVELSRRSSDADRGSAFALFSGGLAAAMTLGSIGGAPLVSVAGFSAAIGVGVALIVGAIALVLADPSMRGMRPREPAAPVEPAAPAAA